MFSARPTSSGSRPIAAGGGAAQEGRQNELLVDDVRAIGSTALSSSTLLSRMRQREQLVDGIVSIAQEDERPSESDRPNSRDAADSQTRSVCAEDDSHSILHGSQVTFTHAPGVNGQTQMDALIAFLLSKGGSATTKAILKQVMPVAPCLLLQLPHLILWVGRIYIDIICMHVCVLSFGAACPRIRHFFFESCCVKWHTLRMAVGS